MPSSSSSGSSSSGSSGSTSAIKGAAGAMRSLGKAMNAVANTVEVSRDDREDPNQPHLNVIAFKLLDLVEMEDSFNTKRGRNINDRSTQRPTVGTPSKPHMNTPVQQRQPQRQPQQQQHAPQYPPRQQQQQQPSQQQQRQPHHPAPTPKQRPKPKPLEPSLMDFVSTPAVVNPHVLGRAASSVSPSARAPRANNNLSKSLTGGLDDVGMTKALKLKAEYQEKARTQNKVWDEVDQRWVEVDPNARVKGNKSEPPAPPSSNKKIVGIKIDASNAIGKSRSVQAGVQGRVQEMQMAQHKAVQEIKQREAETKADADAEDVVRKRLEPKMRAWSEEHGKKKQLRALLGSLHMILWKESGWKPVSLGDLLDEKKARRCYLKATLKVHPDKTRDLDVEKRFIAKRVFDALSQAMTEFENK